MVKDRFLSLARRFCQFEDPDRLPPDGALPTSSMMALAAALLKTGEAMALRSELLEGPLLTVPCLLGDPGGLLLTSLGDPKRRSWADRVASFPRS